METLLSLWVWFWIFSLCSGGGHGWNTENQLQQHPGPKLQESVTSMVNLRKISAAEDSLEERKTVVVRPDLVGSDQPPPDGVVPNARGAGAVASSGRASRRRGRLARVRSSSASRATAAHKVRSATAEQGEWLSGPAAPLRGFGPDQNTRSWHRNWLPHQTESWGGVESSKGPPAPRLTPSTMTGELRQGRRNLEQKVLAHAKPHGRPMRHLAEQELAKEHVPLMRQLQSQLKQQSWVGDPKTECCTSWVGVSCNSAGEVVGLECKWVPTEVMGPDGFETYWIEETQAIQFPMALGFLNSLTSLNVYQMLFNSSLTSELGLLTNLRELHLSDVQSLTTQLEDLTWLSSLQNLEMLGLMKTNMVGAFPDDAFLHLMLLRSISIAEVNVTMIPLGIDALSRSLEELIITDTHMYALLPTRLFALTGLTLLDLHSNRLQGSLPEAGLGSLELLESLYLERNELIGPIPKTIGTSKVLRYLDLSHNRFAGTIPSEIFELQKILYITLDENRLTNPFPTKIGVSGASLNSLSLQNNLLSEPLPCSMGQFRNLSFLSVPNNKFYGKLPAEWANLRKLEGLEVSHNRIVGSPVELLKALPRLSYAGLSFNQFSGVLTDSLLARINLLNIRSNRFTGPFPLAVLGLQGVEFDISYNQFSGPIPDEISSRRVEKLYLNNNNFSGPLPASLPHMRSLQWLNVSHNQLNGTVPTWIFKNLTGIVNVDLSYDYFSGQLPSLSGAFLFTTFSARHNKFSGYLTDRFLSDVGKLDYLLFLDLGHNALTGSLSNANLTFQRLECLYLDHNLLTGNIPPSICKSNLVALSFENNLLTGQLPPCLFSQPPSLQWLDLSDNVLFGELQDFNQVDNTLALANNFFYGSADITANNFPVCSLELNRSQFAPYSQPLHSRSSLKGNCLSPSTGIESDGEYEQGCVKKSRQRSVHRCGAFCGTVGGIQCGGFGVCQPPPEVDLQVQNATFSEMHKEYSEDVDAFREFVRMELEKRATCTCDKYYVLHRDSDMTATCKLALPKPVWKNISTPVAAPEMSTAASGLSPGVIAGICAASVCVILLVGFLLVHILQSKRPRKWKDLDVCRQFSLTEVTRASQGWSSNNLLGEGAFEFVYRGVSPEGELWALKRAKLMSNDFEIEVRAMASLRHPHLVRLLGFCEDLNEATGHHEQILVYEFVMGGDLKEWLHGAKGNEAPLSLAQRLDIVAGVADGLAYLHSFDPPIVHRDIKPANILLDESVRPRVADFGLLKQLFNGKDATRVAGTPGYVDPVYNRSNTVSVSSDVYSLGIVILEMLTGKTATDKKIHTGHVLLWSKPLFESGDADGLKDPVLVAPNEAILEFALLAMDCTRCPAMFRPSMKDVVARAQAIKAK